MQLLNLILAVVAFRALLAFDPAADMAREVEEFFFVSDDTSPLVVVLLAAWLLYRRRASLAALVGRGSAPVLGGSMLAVAAAIFVWACLTQGTHLLAVSLGLLIVAVAALYGGRPAARAVLLPALVLLFAIPIPGALRNYILYDFQIWTANWAGTLLSLLQYPAYVSGEQIVLPDADFGVIEGCSGLRSVQTMALVGLLLSDLFGRRGLHAAAIVVAAPFIAFALNGVRVITLMLNPHSEVVAIHNLQGVAILLAAIAILYGLDGLLERAFAARSGGAGGGPGADSREAGEEAADASEGEASGFGEPARIPALVVSAVLVGLCAASFLVSPFVLREPVRVAPPLATRIASTLGQWQGSARHDEHRFLESVSYREILDRRYRADAHRPLGVDLMVAVAPKQQGLRSTLSPKLALPGSGWEVEDRGTHTIEGTNRDVAWMLVRKGTRRALVNSMSDGAPGVLEQTARALLALEGSPWRSPGEMVMLRTVVELEIPSRGERERAQLALDSFYRAFEPSLTALSGAPSAAVSGSGAAG